MWSERPFSLEQRPDLRARYQEFEKKCLEIISKKQINLDDERLGELIYGGELTLLEGKPLNEETAIGALPYVARRLPPEIFFANQRPLTIIVSNDNEAFNDPKLLRTAPARRRWYTVEEGEKEVTVRIHVRDGMINGTDLQEIMAMLSYLSILRGMDKAEADENLGRMDNRYLRDYEAFQSADNFQRWKDRPITVQFDLDFNRPGAVTLLVERVRERLNKLGEAGEIRKKEPFLLIGNDFSLRLVAFTLLVDDKTIKTLRNKFSEELEKFAEKLQELNLTHDSLKGFLEKYFLLTLLSRKYREGDSDIKAIYNQIFSDENYRKLGFRRLLYAVNRPDGITADQLSPLAEPVDYWNPAMMDEVLLADESDFIRRLFRDLRELGQPIISIPYLIGTLSAELVEEMINRRMIDQTAIGFVGKVGNIVLSKESYIPRGRLVIPLKVKNAGEEQWNYYPHYFRRFPEELSETVTIIHFAQWLVTFPSLLHQGFAAFDGLPYGDIVVADMEQGYLVNRFGKMPQPLEILSCFYISDHSIHPSLSLKAPNLNVPLDPIDGAIGACLSTLWVIYQMVEMRREKTSAVGI